MTSWTTELLADEMRAYRGRIAIRFPGNPLPATDSDLFVVDACDRHHIFSQGSIWWWHALKVGGQSAAWQQAAAAYARLHGKVLVLHANFAVTGIFVVCNLTFVRTGGAIYVLGTTKKSDVPFRLVRELRDLG